jgi:RNA polymerase sigma-70 factor (ECF subfamily)
MTDRILVEKFLKNRDEASFSTLYSAKTPRLYQVALRLTCHNEPEAQDLVQEMWMIAIRKIDLFRWESELKTWLTGILINLSREKRKRDAREQELKEKITAVDEIATEETFSKEDLENAITRLPAGYRQVIILHDIEGYKHQEIASIMDVTVGTSKSQLYHARKVLKNDLRKRMKTN